MADTTLPEQWRGTRRVIPIQSIDWPEARLRTPDLDVAELAESIARQGLQQPIGVKRNGLRFRLIWGRRRLEAYRANEQRLGSAIEAVVYSEELPLEWATILEIDENSKRQDLTQDERREHTVRLAAELKKLEIAKRAGEANSENSELAGQSENSDWNPDMSGSRGGDHTDKGMTAIVAEHQGVDHGTIRHRVKKVSDRLGDWRGERQRFLSRRPWNRKSPGRFRLAARCSSIAWRVCSVISNLTGRPVLFCLTVARSTA
jgi:ParB-like nuclease domain